jgi:hypothetical protein
VLQKTNRAGKYPIRAYYQGKLITSGRENVEDLGSRERLAAHCQALDGAVAWLPRFVQVGDDLSTLQGPQRTLEVTKLSDVTAARVDFWWKPYLPKGRPVALEGDPGIGKSTLVAKIAAHMTTGTPFPTLDIFAVSPRSFAPQHVCLLTAEDDPGDTILPRVAVNGGDPSLVHLIEGWAQTDGSRGVVTMQDLDLLRQALETYHPALLVFDPLQSFLGRGVDMNAATDTRPVLDALTALCKPYDCTQLYVRHIGKTAREKALYSGLGSIDIAACMRSVLFLGQDPDNNDRRIVAQSKSNNARLGPSMAYKLVSCEHDIPTITGLVTVEAPRVDWDGRSDLTANDLSAPFSREKDSATNAHEAAADFLREVLKEGPMLVEDIKGAAKTNSVAWRTIQRAKKDMPVRARRREVEGANAREWPWEWYLSEEEEEEPWEH